MNKNIIILVLLVLTAAVSHAQLLCTNEDVDISGQINMIDSNIYIQVVNKSNQDLLFNDNSMSFYRPVAHNVLAADLSLLSDAVSISCPGPGHFMYFKRLRPQSTYYLVVKKDSCDIITNKTILSLRIEYLRMPNNVSFYERILYRSFIEVVDKENITSRCIEMKLQIDNQSDLNSLCFQPLKTIYIQYLD